MKKEDKIKIAITSGIGALILLILVLVIALSGDKASSDDKKLGENIEEYLAENGSDSLSLSESSVNSDKKDTDKADEKDTDNGKDDVSGNSSALALTEENDENYSAFKDTARASVSGNSFYATKEPVLRNVYKRVTFDKDEQLKEMFRYWSDNNTEAVRDLAHLERYEAMSYELGDSADFYYYGDINSSGQPNGQGLAVYSQDRYYFGQWVNGVRSGNGTWIAFYPYYSGYVVTEHMYTGQWSDDLPNGEGQEHYDYNTDLMNEKDIYLQNVIGGFAAGKYNGNIYVITLKKEEDPKEWVGDANNGELLRVKNASLDDKGLIPVLSARENSENHLYMSISKTKDNGISGLVKSGNLRK